MKNKHRKSDFIPTIISSQKNRRNTHIPNLSPIHNNTNSHKLPFFTDSYFNRSLDNITQMIDKIIFDAFTMPNSHQTQIKQSNLKRLCKIILNYLQFPIHQYQLHTMPTQIQNIQRHLQSIQEPIACQADAKCTFQISMLKSQTRRQIYQSNIPSSNRIITSRRQSKQYYNQIFLKEAYISKKSYFKLQQNSGKVVNTKPIGVQVVALNEQLEQDTPQIDYFRKNLLRQNKTKYLQKRQYLDTQNKLLKQEKQSNNKGGKLIQRNGEAFTYGFSGQKILLKNKKNLKKIQLALNMTIRELQKMQISNINKPQTIKKQISNNRFNREPIQKFDPFQCNNTNVILTSKRLFKDELEYKLKSNKSTQNIISNVMVKTDNRGQSTDFFKKGIPINTKQNLYNPSRMSKKLMISGMNSTTTGF